ncbi:MAG TPA: hypothetical protein VN843_25225 [Anaerolineales bacterium]|nr:hypothetical protein [Anaerolineales bacterium]
MPENPPKYLNDPNDESSLLSFVVHIWKEDPPSEEEQPSWRGHIIPVPNGERHYFRDLNEIPKLIVAYLGLHKQT